MRMFSRFLQSSPTADDLNLPRPTTAAQPTPILPRKQGPPAFLSIPLELRLDIYDLCFVQNVHDPKKHTRKELLDIKRAYLECFHDYSLLLVNHQIHHESKDIAYAAQRSQLSLTHQTYFLSQTSWHYKLSFPKWRWELERKCLWRPSCSSPKALAKLRLPKLGLAIREPIDTFIQINGQLSIFKSFFRELVHHLRTKNVTQSIEVYLQGHDRDILGSVFMATDDFRTSSCATRLPELCDIVYLCNVSHFSNHIHDFPRRLNIKGQMQHWWDAPGFAGRRYPHEFIPALSPY